VLFYEVEKGVGRAVKSLLGILDKATLTLGDNRKVDFSSSMIFLPATSAQWK
jgi:ATP-dependent Clp protease ATP-binding subunit ClpA